MEETKQKIFLNFVFCYNLKALTASAEVYVCSICSRENFQLPNLSFTTNHEGLLRLTVITPVAALMPASPNIAVAASVTKAVAPILTTLSA